MDPRRSDCPSACKGLAGVGVALKLAMAINGPEGDGDVLAEYCDLAAVGTVADVMPMTGENRTIVRLGLEELSHPRRLGLALLTMTSTLCLRPQLAQTYNSDPAVLGLAVGLLVFAAVHQIPASL